MFHFFPRNFCMVSFFKIQKYKSPMNVLLFIHAESNYSNLICQSKPISVPIKNGIQHTFAFSFYETRSNNSRSLKSISSPAEYEQVAEETLQSLSDQFEEVLEDSDLIDWDVTYSNDVLTISLNNSGVYVINKQSPNKQIWLSSPFRWPDVVNSWYIYPWVYVNSSGPKRYDFKDGLWVYKHEGISLHQLLGDEISKVIHKEVNFTMCSYGAKK